MWQTNGAVQNLALLYLLTWYRERLNMQIVQSDTSDYLSNKRGKLDFYLFY